MSDDLTFAQRKGLSFIKKYSGIANPKSDDGGFLRGPGKRVSDNLAAMGLIEVIPDAPRKMYRVTDAGRAALDPLQHQGGK